MADKCPSCGNHALNRISLAGGALDECEMCGELFGPADLVELAMLQREADELGASIESYPLARFLHDQPGVKVIADSNGDPVTGKLPFVSFALTDRRLDIVENLGKTLRLLRDNLECRWIIEYTFDFEPAFELHAARAVSNPKEQVDPARRDMSLIWRALRQYSGFGWWRRPSGRIEAPRR
ncbi:MAG: hypothetical protein IT462_10400 [Planctomycetes bacterium]|nr:hypothetical protein [Planctomycetota bacterium]